MYVELEAHFVFICEPHHAKIYVTNNDNQLSSRNFRFIRENLLIQRVSIMADQRNVPRIFRPVYVRMRKVSTTRTRS